MGRKPLGVIEHIDDLCECLSINAITTTIYLVVVFYISCRLLLQNIINKRGVLDIENDIG